MTNARSYKFQISSVKSADGQDSLRYSFYIDPLEIHSIVFKGGGMRVFVYQTFLEIIEENGTLSRAREVGASSSGALAALFAAIPFEAGKRSEAMDHFTQTTAGTDSIGNSLWWNAYRLASAPLNFISKPMAWSSAYVAWIANQFKKLPLGNLVGAPLNLLSSALQTATTIISPEGMAAIINLVLRGAIFLGDELQASVRDHIQTHTKNALESLLKNPGDSEQSENIIAELISIGLLEKNSSLANLRLTTEISFKHFYHLSKLPDSQFKEIFLTAIRKNDYALKVFNSQNTPDMSIHEAVRITMSIPYLYQDKNHEGEAYIDGGCVNNYPMRLTMEKDVDPILKMYEVHDNQARLGVRVERWHELDYLWKKTKKSMLESFSFLLTRLTHQMITRIDTYAADAEITEEMQKDFAQRSVQIDDQGVSLLEFNMDEAKRKTLLAASAASIREYFENHADEKAVIENFSRVEDMPEWMRDSLLEDLSNPAHGIFCIPEKNALELEILRQEIINKLRPSTNMIFEMLILPTTTPTVTTEDKQDKQDKQENQNKNQIAAEDYSLDSFETRLCRLQM